jgi:hypothetical protein
MKLNTELVARTYALGKCSLTPCPQNYTVDGVVIQYMTSYKAHLVSNANLKSYVVIVILKSRGKVLTNLLLSQIGKFAM